MKSKSPSPDSKKSTPKARLSPQQSYTPVALSFSQRPQCRSKQHCSSVSSPISLFTLLLFPILLSACYVPPGSSQFEVTAPTQTVIPAPVGVPHTLSLHLQTPTPAWQLVPLILYRTGENQYLCVHTLTPPDGMVAQMISSTNNSITFRHAGQSEPTLRHYVLGKTWKWNGNPEVTFIDSLDDIKDALANAQSVPFTTD